MVGGDLLGLELLRKGFGVYLVPTLLLSLVDATKPKFLTTEALRSLDFDGEEYLVFLKNIFSHPPYLV